MPDPSRGQRNRWRERLYPSGQEWSSRMISLVTALLDELDQLRVPLPPIDRNAFFDRVDSRARRIDKA